MSSALSKRQQARNERALQDLIKAVPGNNVCADCQARNPGWASWSLGIFLCMRCAALHRKLGTHITKVKSLSMDSWSTEQVENMKRTGNIASNKIYNPQNSRPPIPFDADEADSAMERFIRQKYQDRAVKGTVRHDNTGSTAGSDEPPPLPPKTGSRFGFRSASSIFPLSSKSRRQAEQQHNFDEPQRSPSPPRGKPVRGFNSGGYDGDGLEGKLATLREMGFRDEKRNTAILKGLGGNLEKSIETLVRLGEGHAPVPVPKTSDSSGPSSRSRTPLSSTAGITIDRSQQITSPLSSNNPFDMLDVPPPPAKPQSSQSTGALSLPQSPMSATNPYNQQQSNSNPFGLMPSQSQVNLNHSFQNMAISDSQPLFPNHTGGFPTPQPTPQQQMYQQSMTPPVPSLPQQFHPPIIYENPAQQPQQNMSYNPFMQQQQPQQPQHPQQQPQAPMINTNFKSNPYLQASPGGQTMYQSSIPQSPQEYRSPSAYHSQSNPFLQGFHQPQMASQQVAQSPQIYQMVQQQVAPSPQNYQPHQQQQYYQQYRSQTDPILTQHAERADKRSILDLYNYPQLVSTNSIQQQQQAPLQNQDMFAVNQNIPVTTQQPVYDQRTISSPLGTQPPVGNRNPFVMNSGKVQNQGADQGSLLGSFGHAHSGTRHMSRESVDVGGWQNGRHSPDAWGTISANSAR